MERPHVVFGQDELKDCTVCDDQLENKREDPVTGDLLVGPMITATEDTDDLCKAGNADQCRLITCCSECQTEIRNLVICKMVIADFDKNEADSVFRNCDVTLPEECLDESMKSSTRRLLGWTPFLVVAAIASAHARFL